MYEARSPPFLEVEKREVLFRNSCDGEGTVITLLRIDEEGEDSFYEVKVVQDEFVLQLQYMSIEKGEAQSQAAFDALVAAGADNIVFDTVR